MTTGSSSTEPASPPPSPEKKSVVGKLRVVLVVVLLFVGAFFGAYYFGTQAQFYNMTNPAGANNNPLLALLDPSSRMKKWYWLHTKGWDRAGYITTVIVNGLRVGRFSKPDVDVDITKLVRIGRNKVVFASQAQSADRRNDNSAASLTIQLKSVAKNGGEKFKGGDTLFEYTRLVTDTDDCGDATEFEITEEQ